MRSVDCTIFIEKLILTDEESLGDLCEFIKQNYRIDEDIDYVVDHEEIKK